MKKMILTMVTILALLFSQLSFSFAGESFEDNGMQITTLESFKVELAELQKKNPKIDSDSKQIKMLVERTNPNVIEQFFNEKMKKIEQVMSTIEPSDTVDYIDLGDGCYIANKPDVGENGISTFASTPGATTLWKDYGARKFTSTFEGYLVIAAFDLNICNHYTLGATGLTPRYVEAWGNGAGLITVTKGDVNEPKRTAKVGETASSNCIFTVTAVFEGANLQKSFKMYNYVKCSEVDKIGKQVKVVQSWKGDYL